jgi:hypothetical protein
MTKEQKILALGVALGIFICVVASAFIWASATPSIASERFMQQQSLSYRLDIYGNCYAIFNYTRGVSIATVDYNVCVGKRRSIIK